MATPGKPSLFLSYNWTHKKIVTKIKEELQSKGFEVWFDIEQMEGSILTAMSAGIERADVFIMAVSGKYGESDNCKKEAVYANLRKKPIIPIKVESGYKPDGWLGILMGDSLYFTFHDESKFQDNFANLLHEIKAKNFANLCQLDTAAIAMAEVSGTESAIEKQKNEQAAKAGLELYRINMAGITSLIETVEVLSQKHLSSEKSAIAKFLEQSNTENLMYQKELQVKITEEYHSLCKSNAKASQEKCDKIFKGLCQGIKKGSYQEYKSSIEKVVREFKETPVKGIQQEYALTEFLKSIAEERRAIMETDSKMNDSDKKSEETTRKDEMTEQERIALEEEKKQTKQQTEDKRKSAEENIAQLKKKLEDDKNKRIDKLKEEHEKEVKDSGKRLNFEELSILEKATAGMYEATAGVYGATAGVYEGFTSLLGFS